MSNLDVFDLKRLALQRKYILLKYLSVNRCTRTSDKYFLFNRHRVCRSVLLKVRTDLAVPKTKACDPPQCKVDRATPL